MPLHVPPFCLTGSVGTVFPLELQVGLIPCSPLGYISSGKGFCGLLTSVSIAGIFSDSRLLELCVVSVFMLRIHTLHTDPVFLFHRIFIMGFSLTLPRECISYIFFFFLQLIPRVVQYAVPQYLGILPRMLYFDSKIIVNKQETEC